MFSTLNCFSPQPQWHSAVLYFSSRLVVTWRPPSSQFGWSAVKATSVCCSVWKRICSATGKLEGGLTSTTTMAWPTRMKRFAWLWVWAAPCPCISPLGGQEGGSHNTNSDGCRQWALICLLLPNFHHYFWGLIIFCKEVLRISSWKG